MPSFASLGAIPPELCSRLVVATGDGETTVAIDTPQALLSRPPNALRLLTTNGATSSTAATRIPEEEVTQLRQAVAHALIDQSPQGERLDLIRRVLEQWDQGQNSSNNGKMADEQEQNPHGSVPQYNCFSSFPAMKIHGVISVLDVVRSQAVFALPQQQLQPRTTMGAAAGVISNSISTGSEDLDRLLAFPAEVTTALTSAMGDLLARRVTVPKLRQYHHQDMPSILAASILAPPTTTTAGSGGIALGYVTQFSGACATGKTQLALQLALSAAVDGRSVLYLASATGHGSLRTLASRLNHMARHKQLQLHQQMFSPLAHDETAVGPAVITIKTLLDRISLEMVQDGYHLLRILAVLETTLRQQLGMRQQPPPEQQQQQVHPLPSLIVVDSASGCLNTEDDGLLQSVALRLKYLGRHYRLAIVITNAAVTPPPATTKTTTNASFANNSNSGTSNKNGKANLRPQKKPALGALWSKAADIHVFLQDAREDHYSNDDSDNHRQLIKTIRARLDQHPMKACCSYQPSRATAAAPSSSSTSACDVANFVITNQGIRDVPVASLD